MDDMQPGMGKGKPFMKGKPSLGDEEMDMGDEEMELGDEEEGLGDEEEELGDEEMELGDEEEEFGDEEEELGDEEMGDEFGGEEGEEEFDDEGNPLPDPMDMGGMGKKPMMGGKKPMIGRPHNNAAFMRRMKEACGMKEECGCEGDKGKDTPDKLIKPDMGEEGEGEGEGKEGKPAFLSKKSKKSKKMEKKMKDGCEGKKCNKESYEHAPPKGYYQETDEEFLASLNRQFGKVDERFSDGVCEDSLINPDTIKPGEPGWAPSTRIGEVPSQEPDTVSESVKDMIRRIDQIEKDLRGS